MSGAWPMSSFARESTLSSCTGRSVRSAFSTSRTARLSPRSSDATSAHRSRSEEHTSELQSLMRISYAVFCLTKQTYSQASRVNRHDRQEISSHLNSEDHRQICLPQ